MNKSLLFLGILFGFFCSCGYDKLSPLELEHYVNDGSNQLIQSHNTSDLKILIKYYPSELEAYKQLAINKESNQKVNLNEFLNLKEELSQITLFQLRIQGLEEKDPFKTKEIYERVPEYVNFGIKGDIKLISGGDTIDCNAVHLEHNSKLNQELTWQLIFQKPLNELTTDFYLIYNGGLTNNTEIRFAYSLEQIKKIPQLKI